MVSEFIEDNFVRAEKGYSQKISALVVSYNRASLIETCLRALLFADEVLVVDKSSTDGTAEIARSIASRVISVPWSPVVEDTRAFAILKCTYDWILCLDDDECLSVDAARFIREEVKNPRADVYMLPQRHYILGIHDERAYYWPEYQPRFFRRGTVDILPTVHGGIKPKTGSVYAIPPEIGACIHHLSHENVEKWIEKANRYTSRIDRSRDDDWGRDVVSYAHSRIDGWWNMSKSDDRGDYAAVVAVLRAVYDIIDRLKTWELEEGVDGGARFQKICRSLNNQYMTEFSQRNESEVQVSEENIGEFTLGAAGEHLGNSHAEVTVNALRENLRKARLVVDDLRRRSETGEGKMCARLQAELDDARISADEQRTQFERQLQDMEVGVRSAQERLRAFEEERDGVLRAVIASQDATTQIREALSQMLTEKHVQIAFLTQRLADAERDAAAQEARRLEAENQLGSVLSSETWKLTAPARKLVELTRRSAGLQKARAHLIRSAILSRDPKARIVLSNSIRRRLRIKTAMVEGQAPAGTSTANLAPHESVVASYPSWLLRMDTPDAEVLAAMEATSSSMPEVAVIVRLTKKTFAAWDEMLTAVKGIVGLKWTASIIFELNVDRTSVEKFKRAVGADTRFSFDPPKVSVGQIVLLIDAGAIPRLHGPRILVDELRRDETRILAYADEDYLPRGGLPQDPWFKPGFSPLLAKQGALLGKMVALRWANDASSDVIRRAFNQELDLGAAVRDMSLSIDSSRIVHVPHVAFHDVMPSATLVPLEAPALPDSLPIVSILIPTRDGWHLLGPCLESLQKTDWPQDRLEIIIIDNGSTDSETLDGMSLAEREGRIRILRDPREFNYARLNNVAARASHGDLLVLLNNDTEIIDPAWLRKMAAYAMLPGVGAVGPKLLYGDGTVQHAGVVLGIQGVAAHAHLSLAQDADGYRGLASLTHEVAAVTGACLVVSKSAFEEVGGLREELRVAFNDIVFCLDLLARGRRNIYFAEALVTHHESKTRGYDDKPEKVQLLRKEARIAWSYHREFLWRDPCYSPNLSMEFPYRIAFAPRRRPVWNELIASRRPRVMMLSSTHARGHGVAVVIDLQVQTLLAHGYDVVIAGFLGSNDFEYIGCQKIDVRDPKSVATIAAELNVDVVVAHTPPFFDVARWTGNVPPVIAYDYGEPPPSLFPDTEARQDVLDQKALSLSICAKVFAISNAVAQEAVMPPDGVIPLGNEHLGRWDQESRSRRSRIRRKSGWEDKFVILNVCRFHAAERLYKGVDRYIEMYDVLQTLDPVLAARTVLVLCGKGNADDIEAMTARGVCVRANVSDEEMVDLYAGADLYANFSQWEGYNLGVGQALAMGLPVIASDIPAHRAFGVDVTSDAMTAALLVRDCSKSSGERRPKVWEWREPLETFVTEIDKIVDARVAKV